MARPPHLLSCCWLRATAARVSRCLPLCCVLTLSCGEPVELECRQAAVSNSLVNGATRSDYVYLDVAEERALLGLYFPNYDGWCSGTLIAPAAVLTAAHCLEAEANGAYQVALVSGATSLGVFEARAVLHDTLDVALVLLDTAPLAGSAVPLALDDAPRELGEVLQIQGYGYDEYGELGILRFAVSSVLSLDETFLTLGTDGENGLCAGDSGAAALSRAASGEVVVSGVLTSGVVSCQGSDQYVRGSALKAWVESIIASLPQVEPGADAHSTACERLGSRGRCFGQVAVWCTPTSLTSQACDERTPCGWHSNENGFRCVAPSDDPCLGHSDLGSCDDGVARVCRSGVLHESPCHACNADCTRNSASGLVRCSVSN